MPASLASRPPVTQLKYAIDHLSPGRKGARMILHGHKNNDHLPPSIVDIRPHDSVIGAVDIHAMRFMIQARQDIVISP